MNTKDKKRPIVRIQNQIFRALLVIIALMTLILTLASILINVHYEKQSLDQNLQNMAQTIASSQIIIDDLSDDTSATGVNEEIDVYLKSLQSSLENIDIISIIDTDNVRHFHTNDQLVGTKYDGTAPIFSDVNGSAYVTSDVGPSGRQRRAYAAIYDNEGKYIGFVLAVRLNVNINKLIVRTVWIHLLCAAAAVIIAAILSKVLSRRIKMSLLGYEPDTFSAMYSIRDNTLESLEEGVIAVGLDEKIIYSNRAAAAMFGHMPDELYSKKLTQICPALPIKRTLEENEKIKGFSLETKDSSSIIVNQIPIHENGNTVGAVLIFNDKTEFTKVMEDLSGVRYLVDSMRANNHDFVNKLHVILGLIQMGKTEDACEYITSVTSIQQTVIHGIMNQIDDPSIAALLIGKYAHASELNVNFDLKSGSSFRRSNINVPSGDLVTIIGNLLDNAMDSMNEKKEPPKELSIGIFTQPNALLITVDDTGLGIEKANLERIFENGFSTKGNSHGTGLHVVKELIDKYDGTISVDSEVGEGTSFTVTLTNVSN